MITISAHLSHLNKTENAKRQSHLLSDLLSVIGWDATIKQAYGRYKGIEEECFVIKALTEDSDRILEISQGILDLAQKYGQEAVGAVDLEALTMSAVNMELETQTFELGISTDEPDGDYLRIDDTYYFPTNDITDDLEIYAIIVYCQE